RDRRFRASHNRNMASHSVARRWHCGWNRHLHFHRSQNATIALAALLCLFLLGCAGHRPQKGGHARHSSPSGARSELAQPENPKDSKIILGGLAVFALLALLVLYVYHKGKLDRDGDGI